MRIISFLLILTIAITIPVALLADVQVSLPDTSAYPGTVVKMALSVSDLTAQNIFSFQFRLQYNPSIVKILSVDSSQTLTEDWGAIWSNLEAQGNVLIGNYGTTSLVGSGTLLWINLQIIGEVDNSTNLLISDFEFNAGNPEAIITNGSIKIDPPPISVSFEANFLDSIAIYIDNELHFLPFDTTWIYGTEHSIGMPTYFYRTTDMRYKFEHWSDFGDSTHSVAPVSDTTFTLYLNKEYSLMINSPHGNFLGEGWYSAGDTAYFSIDTLEYVTDSTRYAFAEWHGSNEDAYSGPNPSSKVIVNSAIIEMATWKTQHLLSIESQYGNFVGDGWHDEGSVAIIRVDSIASNVQGTRYIFQNWTGIGNKSYTGTIREVEIVVWNPIVQAANWKTEFFLDLMTKPLGIFQFENNGWYEKNAIATTDLAPNKITETDAIYEFENWYKSGVLLDQNPVSVEMDTSHVLEARYTIDSVLVNIGTNFDIDAKLIIDGKIENSPFQPIWKYQSEHFIDIESIQFNADSTIRYLFNNWSDGGAISHIVIADTGMQIEATLNRELLLSVDTYPPGLIEFSENGWYEIGDTINLPNVPDQIIVESDTFSFKGWQIDNKPLDSNRTIVIMDIPHSLIALYDDLYFICGKVTDTREKLLANVAFVLTGTATDTLATSGNDSIYCFSLLKRGQYRVAPILAGFSFEPEFREYSLLKENQLNQNFVGKDTLAPQVRLTYPNGDEALESTKMDSIVWSAQDNAGIDSVKIGLSIDGGASWQTFANLKVSAEITSYGWEVPTVSSSQCKIKITVKDFDGNFGVDESDKTFTIKNLTSVDSYKESNIPSEFRVYQNYPNPFNNHTVIPFDIPERSYVTIKIYNMMGQEIVRLLQEELDSGRYRVNWNGADSNGSAMTSGIYFYRVTSEQRVVTRRLVFIR